MDRPLVSDSRLSSLLDDLYRPGGTIGNGSTAAAVRHEIATGLPVLGREHSQKARDYIVALERFIRRNPNSSANDIRAAQNVIRDLRNALGGN
jgi:filamentous hemagglutinin